MSTKTATYGLIKPELTDAADITAMNGNWDTIDSELSKTGKIVQATSTDGVAYTAEVPGIARLYSGLEITIIPNMTSTSVNATLNINGLGAKSIRLPLGVNTSATVAANLPTFLGKDRPVKLLFDDAYLEGGIWKTISTYRTSATDLYGATPIENGGTGANNGVDGLKNLLASGAVILSPNQYGDTLPDPGTPGRLFFLKV